MTLYVIIATVKNTSILIQQIQIACIQNFIEYFRGPVAYKQRRIHLFHILRVRSSGKWSSDFRFTLLPFTEMEANKSYTINILAQCFIQS